MARLPVLERATGWLESGPDLDKPSDHTWSMAQKKRRKPEDKARKEVVLLKDLAPRQDVKGGAKLRFGEAPASSTGKGRD